MRVVFHDDAKLVIHNGCTSDSQGRWATLILGLGFLGLFFLLQKVVGNLLYFWSGILFHVMCFILICWYFAPVVTNLDKNKGTVSVEYFNAFCTKSSKYPLGAIKSIQLKNVEPTHVVSTIYLVLESGKHLYLSNAWQRTKSCQKVLYMLNIFLDKNSSDLEV
jgi:hypothetical protein